MNAADLRDLPSRLNVHLGRLGAALVAWGTRDDSKAQPEVRQAANDAMDAIDAMLAGLHRARRQLVDETRESDDATAVRVDALLARLREDGAR
jgi:hypothetical protein